MSLVRQNGPGWAPGDELSHAQITAVDAAIEGALDKRAGHTDALASIVSCGGSGRIVDSYATGPDADTTFLMSGANSIINAATLTAARTYRLSNTGAIAGDRLTILRPASGSALYHVIVQNDVPSTIAILGAGTDINSDSAWADFVFTGSAWIVLRSALAAALVPMTFIANGTWTCPRGVSLALAIGCGGGGGGGGARAGDTTDNHMGCGGGGGGGARYHVQLVTDLVPGAYDVVIGDGGSGGAGGAFGVVGGDTLLQSGGTIYATCPGAGGGAGLANLTADQVTYVQTLGGPPSRFMQRVLQNGSGPANPADQNWWTSSAAQIVEAWGAAGSGGFGVNVLSSNSSHAQSGFTGEGPTPFAGGAGGAVGGVVGSKYGGGGGGGGGGGPFGVGGAGSNGGAGSATNGVAGTAGFAAAANTGAGGGGAGGGGCGGTTAGAAANGGKGGSGRLIMIPLR